MLSQAVPPPMPKDRFRHEVERMIYYLAQSGAYSAWAPSVLVTYATELVKEIKSLQDEGKAKPKHSYEVPISIPPPKAKG